MFNKIFKNLTNLFKKKKSKAIPFTEASREKVLAQKGPDHKLGERRKIQPETKPPQNLNKEKNIQRKKSRPAKPKWTIDKFKVAEQKGKTRFHDLKIPLKLMRAIHQQKFEYCTPVQAETLPHTLEKRDAIAQAQTGTGKTAAFLITIISNFIKKPVKGGPPKGFPRALILAPTRELALQIKKDADLLTRFTPFKVLAVFGGIGYEKQKSQLQKRSFDIIIATPGRLIDYLNKRLLNLSRIEVLVIDEADRMLDMGFIPDIRKIVYKTPPKGKRQTLFYSATYTEDVERLANQWTRNAYRMAKQTENITADTINQKVYLVTADEKFKILFNLISKASTDDKILIFTNRRDQTRELSEKLNSLQLKTEILSGEVHQNKRMRALENFKTGRTKILVATDVAARGIHIDGISHVINYNIPNDPEHYVHRIGRTGRAGATGISISFACEDESFYIPAIEEVLGSKLSCEYPDDELLKPAPMAKPVKAKPEAPRPKKRPVQKKNYRSNNKRPQKYKKKYEPSKNVKK